MVRRVVRLGALALFVGWAAPRAAVTAAVLSAQPSIEGLIALAAWWGYAPALALLIVAFPRLRRIIRRIV